MVRYVRFSAVVLAVALAAGACTPASATPSAGTSPGGSGVPSVAPTGSAAATATAVATTPAAPTASAVLAHWATAGNLPSANAGWSETHVLLVSGGKILVVGDDNANAPGPPSAVGALIWDPGTGKWTATASLNAPREYFAAESLKNGQAIVFGAYSSAKLYDPATGKWTATGLMTTARMNLASTRLKDGRVMAIGGEYMSGSTDKILASVEIYDPATGKWTVTGALNTARRNAQAVTLADGRVLVVGGDGGDPTKFASAEIWTPGTGKWSAAGNLALARDEFSLLALPDGSALVAGGLDTTAAVATTEKLDMATLKWKPGPAMKSAAASRITATLADGKILLAGGRPGSRKPAIAAAEIFDPVAGTFAATAAIPTTQERSGAVLLGDGSVMVAGGDGGFTGPASAPWYPDTRLGALRYYPAKP